MSNRKNSDHFTFDFVGRKIVGTKTSLNKAKHYGSDEYYELRKMMKEQPQFKVAAKEVKHRAKKQTYKKLSFDFIEKYISIQSDADEIKREYERVKKIAADLKLSVYPLTKSWFLERFGSENTPFDMKKAIKELETAGIDVTLFAETQDKKPAASQTEAAA